MRPGPRVRPMQWLQPCKERPWQLQPRAIHRCSTASWPPALGLPAPGRPAPDCRRLAAGGLATSAWAAGPVAAQALTARPSLDGTRATGYPHLRGQRWPNFSVTEVVSVVGDDLPKQAVRLAVGPGGEDQLACLGCVPIAEAQAPQTV